MPQISNAAIGGTMNQKVIFLYFLYLFRHTALKQHPIKKLYKVIIGKTVSKSTMSANKPSESLCSLLAIPFIPYTNKTCSNKSNFRFPKNIRYTHIRAEMESEISTSLMPNSTSQRWDVWALRVEGTRLEM